MTYLDSSVNRFTGKWPLNLSGDDSARLNAVQQVFPATQGVRTSPFRNDSELLCNDLVHVGVSPGQNAYKSGPDLSAESFETEEIEDAP